MERALRILAEAGAALLGPLGFEETLQPDRGRRVDPSPGGGSP